MGRQLAIAMSQVDEEKFINFLHATGEIALFENFSSTKEGLWVTNFASQMTDHWKYYVWNKAFTWEPEYRQTTNALTPEGNGLYYIANTNDAPIIEIVRSNIKEGRYGRIYWAKYFSAPNGLNYDIVAFSRWYDTIVRWIKKNAPGKQKEAWITYFLPNAWKNISSTKN